MSEAKSPLIYKAKLESVCVFLSILSAVVLLIVWALAGTIAVRNISIALGLLASTGWVLLVRPNITRSDLIVPALLMGVPIWLWIIYFFFSIDVAAQFKEMVGTWFRVVALIIFGLNLGLICSRNQSLKKWVWIGLLIIPASSFLYYLYDAYRSFGWNIAGYTAFYKTKVAAVYFIMWPLFLGCAGIHKCFYFYKRNDKFYNLALMLFPFSVLISLSIFMFFVINALTGILVAMILCGVLTILCFHCSLRNQLGARKLTITLLIAFLALSCGYQYWIYDQAHEKKLFNLFIDVMTSINSHANLAWVGIAGEDNSMPLSSYGAAVNGSTYQRTSWFIEGVKYLIKNPLGSGDVHFSFGKYMNIAYPGSNTTKTHSGWLDFGLGVGLPGLILLWSGIYFIFKSSLKSLRIESRDYSIFAVLWIIGGTFLLWWPAELSYREFIEHYFFMLTYLAAISTAFISFRK